MKDFYQRNLPHYQPAGGEFFVTFRLANSLPQKIIQSLKQEFKESIKAEGEENRNHLNKLYFGKFDSLLDHSESGEKWLENDEIAKIIANKIHDFDDDKYVLICFCIMPNHVHLLFKILKRDKARSTYPVTNILRLIKGSTARKANKILGRSGSFWQHESYDHLVRSDDERERIIRYILNNPVKAGLSDFWKDWRWTYCKEEYLPVR
jgi:REP element-mobilizing transposase RayT